MFVSEEMKTRGDEKGKCRGREQRETERVGPLLGD